MIDLTGRVARTHIKYKVLFQGFNKTVDILFGVEVMCGDTRLFVSQIDMDAALFQGLCSPLLFGDVGIEYPVAVFLPERSDQFHSCTQQTVRKIIVEAQDSLLNDRQHGVLVRV